MNPIADYLDELSGQLRRSRRRRILSEVHTHLLEGADTLRDLDPDQAARCAVERFGPPARVASQFNALRRRPCALLHRAAAVMLASAAMATLGTATVWAIEPGSTHAHPHPHHHRQAQRIGARR